MSERTWYCGLGDLAVITNVERFGIGCETGQGLASALYGHPELLQICQKQGGTVWVTRAFSGTTSMVAAVCREPHRALMIRALTGASVYKHADQTTIWNAFSRLMREHGYVESWDTDLLYQWFRWQHLAGELECPTAAGVQSLFQALAWSLPVAGERRRNIQLEEGGDVVAGVAVPAGAATDHGWTQAQRNLLTCYTGGAAADARTFGTKTAVRRRREEHIVITEGLDELVGEGPATRDRDEAESYPQRPRDVPATEPGPVGVTGAAGATGAIGETGSFSSMFAGMIAQGSQAAEPGDRTAARRLMAMQLASQPQNSEIRANSIQQALQAAADRGELGRPIVVSPTTSPVDARLNRMEQTIERIMSIMNGMLPTANNPRAGQDPDPRPAGPPPASGMSRARENAARILDTYRAALDP